MNITCTGCQGILVVGEELRGKSVRCAQCNTVTRVIDAPAPESAPATGIKDAAHIGSVPAGSAIEDEPTRPTRRTDYDDDDFDPQPRPIARRRNPSGQNAMVLLIIGLIAVFFVVPFVIAGVMGFVFRVAEQRVEDQIKIAEAHEHAEMKRANEWDQNFNPERAAFLDPEQPEPPAKVQHKKFIVDNLAVNEQEGDLAPDSKIWHEITQRMNQPLRKSPRLNGHRGVVDFHETAPEGGILVGFFIGATADQNFIEYLQPIYLTKKGEKVGRAYGAPHQQPVRFRAKPGYAVGAVHTRSGDLLDGFWITFMKVQGTRLLPQDAYDSPPFGGFNGDLMRIDGEGRLIVGIHGRRQANQDWTPPGRLTTFGLISLP